MNEFEELLQERLERLEAGEPLAICVEGLSEEEAGLLQVAAALRQLPVPLADPTIVARQRAQLLQSIKREPTMSEKNDKVPFTTWLRSLLTTVPGAAAALVAFVLIVWLSFSLFRPDVPSKTETAVNPPTTTSEETVPSLNNPTQEPESSPDLTTTGPEENVTQVAETTESVVEAEEAEETAVAPPAPTQPAHMAFFPILEVSSLINAHTATLLDPNGLVEVQDKEGIWHIAKRGTPIEQGQRVRTGALSSAKILFYDGSQATLAANAEISIDQLNAQQPQNGFRTVVLTQWLGQSEHHVAFRNDNGSRYEVNTPNGSGVARGTIFQVMVTADLLTHYTVLEGRVDVTNLNVTIIVVAGQITVINPNQAPSTPYFNVSGQGEVTAIGQTWTIGGQNFTTTATTLTIGNPQIGDIVHVTGYMLPDGTLVATIITLLHHNPVNQFSLIGEVTTIDFGSWVVAGQTISVTTATVINEAIILGNTVRVRGLILADGTLVAESIDLVTNNYPFEFVGIVSAIAAESWTISGVEIAINADTRIEDGIEVGDVVRVEGATLEDGTWLAHDIRSVQEEADFEFTGTVNSINPWVVAGIGFAVDEFTHIGAGIVAGSLVRVQGQILPDGTWLATAITLLDEDEPITVSFVGMVDSIDPWIVSGITLTTDATTMIEAGIEVGDMVRVTAVILPDGSFLAVTIRLINDDSFPLGCFTIAATVIGISGNVVTLRGLPAITLNDDINIQGNLAANTIIIITLCVGEDGTITIINIIVIYTIPLPPTAPPGGGSDDDEDDDGGQGGQVTICHIPSGNPGAQHTITVSQAALGVHLGHGDTIGPCSRGGGDDDDDDD